MEPLTIVLLVLLAVAVAAIIFLMVKYFKTWDDATRQLVLDRLGETVEVVIAALKDGKIEQAELKQILESLIRVIAAIKGDYVSVVTAKYDAEQYLE